MPARTNQIAAADVVASLDREFLRNFDGEVNQLTDILGIASPTIMAAGMTLYQYDVTGSLNDGEFEATSDQSVVTGKTYYTRSGSAGAYVYTEVESPKDANIASYYELTAASGNHYIEGDEVALSKYSVTKTPVGSLTLVPYRKATTAQAIAKSGFERAVVDTDNQMVKDIRAACVSKFFTYLATGTGTATGTTLQAALANVNAALDIALEANNDSADRVIHFVHPSDIAGYLGTANVGLASLFGMRYLETFLGIDDIVVTSKVSQGTVIATPAENIRIYGADFGELARGDLAYEVSDSGLIGVHHIGNYARVSAETNVLTAMTILAEKLPYIVKGTIAPAA